MALYGYARVSSSDQNLTLQEQALRAAGCEVIRAEKVSGTSREGRTELQLLLDFCGAEIRSWLHGLTVLAVASKIFKTSYIH